MYRYGEEISYDFKLLKVEDYEDLQPFTCSNKKLDAHIHRDVIKNNEIVDEDDFILCLKIQMKTKLLRLRL